MPTVTIHSAPLNARVMLDTKVMAFLAQTLMIVHLIHVTVVQHARMNFWDTHVLVTKLLLPVKIAMKMSMNV
jgi:hypothetical protein